jgi:amino acid transporter
MDTGKIFVRPASGLVKAISTWGAILFGIHCISLSSSGFIPFSWVASVWPGANIIGLLTIAMLTSLLHGYVYASIGGAMPRAGADYVLASRVLSPIPAFVASFTLVVFSGIVAGGLVAWIPKSALPALLQPVGIIFKNQTYLSWASYSSSSQGSLVIGSICVLLVFGLTLLPTKTVLKILSLGLVLGLGAWLVIFYSLIASSGPQAFREAWNHFVGTTSSLAKFDNVVPLAHAAGMTISHNPATMTVAGLIMGFWIYYGYYIPTFFAGEVQTGKTSRSFIIASWSSIIVTWLVFVIGVYLLERLVPQEWIAAEGYLANNPDAVTKVAGQPVLALPWITFYAAILKPRAILVLFTAFAWVYTLINLVQTYFFYSSRIIFAWSFDRVVPGFLSALNPRTKTPIYSLIVIALLAEIGVIDAARGGPLGTQLAFAFFAVVTQLVSVLAITLFPYRRPTEFRLCPSFMRGRLFGIPAITIAGTATLLYLFWMIVASFLFPAVGVPNPGRTLLLLFVIAAAGLLVFLTARWYRRKYEGIEITAVYQEAPPA